MPLLDTIYTRVLGEATLKTDITIHYFKICSDLVLLSGAKVIIVRKVVHPKVFLSLRKPICRMVKSCSILIRK